MDIYAFGILLYEHLQNVPPYKSLLDSPSGPAQPDPVLRLIHHVLRGGSATSTLTLTLTLTLSPTLIEGERPDLELVRDRAVRKPAIREHVEKLVAVVERCWHVDLRTR